MKKLTLLMTAFLLSFSLQISAQNTGVSDVTHTPDASAVLDVYSTSKGMLIPRVTDSTAITSPASGLLAYFTSTKSFWYFDSFKWCELIADDMEGDIKIGGTSNYVEIQEDGSLVLVGEATVYDDLTVPVTTSKKGHLDPPSDLDWLGNLVVYGFDKTDDESILFVVQLPHKYVQGTDILPHVHWFPTDGGGGDVVWSLEYTWASFDNVFPTPLTISYTASAGTTANKHLIASLPPITPLATQGGISSMLICRLYRDANNNDDDYDAEAGLLEFDFHYKINSMGSREPFIK